MEDGALPPTHLRSWRRKQLAEVAGVILDGWLDHRQVGTRSAFLASLIKYVIFIYIYDIFSASLITEHHPFDPRTWTSLPPGCPSPLLPKKI